MNNDYLRETPLLNFSQPTIQSLIQQRGWQTLPVYNRIGAVYNFVQNEIAFGYNSSDELSATSVLAEDYGQCNTKAILLMALLRAVDISCRFHGFTIDKKLQKGAMTGLVYQLAPNNIIHSWVEVWYEDRWIELEGFILDRDYLKNLQNKFPTIKNNFCGYGVAIKNFQSPAIEWRGDNTYIQADGINHDFGIYDSPDDFYQQHGSNLSGLKKWLYSHWFRHGMNRNVAKIRKANCE